MSEIKIPKIIHYCWFGGKPLPQSVIKRIESWKKFMPDYEIKRWDESNYDINKSQYMKEAYEHKKYAFVSDYARFDILYQYGGLYFDTDVEIIRSLSEIVRKGPFMGLETGKIDSLLTKRSSFIAPGLGVGAYPKMELLKEIISEYDNRCFLDNNGKMNLSTVCVVVTNLLRKKTCKKIGDTMLVGGFYIYPPVYFNPKGKMRAFGRIKITDKTYSIHHFDATWKSKKEITVMKFLKRILKNKI